jgi:hypothetical protein
MPWLYYTVKTEYLPRQARDKHRESTHKKGCNLSQDYDDLSYLPRPRRLAAPKIAPRRPTVEAVGSINSSVPLGGGGAGGGGGSGGSERRELSSPGRLR